MKKAIILDKLEKLFDDINMDFSALTIVAELINVSLPEAISQPFRIYSDILPMGKSINPYTVKQRVLHITWDMLELSMFKFDIDFAVEYRQMIAKRLFKTCGNNFTALNGVKFNYGHQIEIGDNVFFNEGVFLDSKGGIKIGNSVGLTEQVMIFTHGHGEDIHSERHYKPVIIEDYVKVYSRSIINFGVTLHKGAIVGANSIVTKDVPAYMLAAGSPATIIRARKNNDRYDEDLQHVWHQI